MFEKIDHVAIAVQNLDEVIKYYVDTLGGIQERPIHNVPERNTALVMISLGDVKFEFMAPINNEGPVSQFLEKHGEGLHHIGVEVSNVEKEIEALSDKGMTELDKRVLERPNAKVAYIHPEAMSGVSVEMMEFEKKA